MRKHSFAQAWTSAGGPRTARALCIIDGTWEEGSLGLNIHLMEEREQLLCQSRVNILKYSLKDTIFRYLHQTQQFTGSKPHLCRIISISDYLSLLVNIIALQGLFHGIASQSVSNRFYQVQCASEGTEAWKEREVIQNQQKLQRQTSEC